MSDIAGLIERAKVLIGAQNDHASEAVKQSNINQAWHLLSDVLAALTAPVDDERVEGLAKRLDPAYPYLPNYKDGIEAAQTLRQQVRQIAALQAKVDAMAEPDYDILDAVADAILKAQPEFECVNYSTARAALTAFLAARSQGEG